jgi:hypothetical protein
MLTKDDCIENVVYNRFVTLTDKIVSEWHLESNAKSQTYYVVDCTRERTKLFIGVFSELLCDELEPQREVNLKIVYQKKKDKQQKKQQQ